MKKEKKEIPIRHIFRDGTVIEGSLVGRGIVVPYNEQTAPAYKLIYENAMRNAKKEATS